MSLITTVGTVVATAGSLFKGFLNFKDSGETAAKNFESDRGPNTQHAINFFNEHYSDYKDLITPDEWDYLKSQLVSRVTENPYYGGLGTSYVSKYSGRESHTVPGVGLMMDADTFIAQKQAYAAETGQAAAAAQSSSLDAQKLGVDGLTSLLLPSLLSNSYADNANTRLQPAVQVTDYTALIITGVLILGLILFFLRTKGR
jgi:hypothetical protein